MKISQAHSLSPTIAPLHTSSIREVLNTRRIIANTDSQRQAPVISVEERAAQLGNLLIPRDAPRLLRFLDVEVPSVFTKPLTDDQMMAKWMKESISHPLRPTGKGVSNGYTQDDVDTIKAMTGYNFIAFDGGTTVVDDDGNPVSYEVSKMIMKIADRIETDRSLGLLVGDITESYLRGVFKDFEKNGKPFPEDWLKRGLAYVRERDTPRPTAVRRSITA